MKSLESLKLRWPPLTDDGPRSNRWKTVFARPQAAELLRRPGERRRLMQVVTGARQVGKTTLVTQVLHAGRAWPFPDHTIWHILMYTARFMGGIRSCSDEPRCS
jgi:hypothetical protein